MNSTKEPIGKVRRAKGSDGPGEAPSYSYRVIGNGDVSESSDRWIRSASQRSDRIKMLPSGESVEFSVNDNSDAGSDPGNFLNEIRPTVLLMRLIGFYPDFPTRTLGLRNSRSCAVRKKLLAVYTLTLTFLNFGIFGYTAFVVYTFERAFGTLHALTIASIITGLKPLVNFLNLFLFYKNAKFHTKLLNRFARTDSTFKTYFDRRLPTRKLNRYFKALFGIAFAVPFAFRIAEYVYMGEVPGTDWMADVSLIVVPFLTIWGVAPLMYFGLCMSMVRFWMETLTERIRKDKRVSKRPLKFYYKQFLNLTEVCHAVGYLLNPFVFFSFAWSVVVLCLAIYFCTQTKSFIVAPPASLIPPDYLTQWKDLVYFNIGWSAIQVFLAGLHVGVMCYFGIGVNEQARAITGAVLAIDLREETESDRYQVSCFVHKISTQFAWGVTVWRAFPVERGVLFTLISLTITYALILVKLKQSDPSVGFSDEQSDLIRTFLNETVILRDVLFGRIFFQHASNRSLL